MIAPVRGLALLLSTAIVLAAAGCGPKAPSYDYAKEPNPRKAEFVIGVSDVLEITVWKNEALSTQVVVRPDGTITMPLVGDLVAAGKTPSALKQEIAAKLQEYVKLEGSEVTVAVDEINSIRFTVSGEVAQPGVYTSKVYVTVAEAIALAGGFTRFASKDEITLLRRDAQGTTRRIPIVYSLIANGEHPEMNLVVMPGDSLYVP